MRRFFLALVVLATGAFSSNVHAEDVGVVVLHGKWGTTSGNNATTRLARTLEAAGFKVELPEMPWSRDRAYDRDVQGALEEIDAAAKRLRDKGAARIVVAGQSLGANVVLIYGARRQGLAGLMAISPGHIPEFGQSRKDYASDVAKARDMVKSGRARAKEYFLDINTGERKMLSVAADIYLSWMDPSGAAVMPTNAANIKSGTPFLWVVGDKDVMNERGKAYAYDKVPANPKNAYIVIPGGAHSDTPVVGAPQIVQWLKAL